MKGEILLKLTVSQARSLSTLLTAAISEIYVNGKTPGYLGEAGFENAQKVEHIVSDTLQDHDDSKWVQTSEVGIDP